METQEITLDDYIERLKNLKNQFGNLKLVYSTDDEGNFFYDVGFLPEAGVYDESEGSFVNESDAGGEGINAICVN